MATELSLLCGLGLRTIADEDGAGPMVPRGPVYLVVRWARVGLWYGFGEDVSSG